MAHRKKTLEELELAAHNRLKGTICFHVSSAISQLQVIKRKLTEYKSGAEYSELHELDCLINTLTHIEAATDRFKLTLYSKLDIGNSPSSYRSRPSRSKKQLYPHVSNQ